MKRAWPIVLSALLIGGGVLGTLRLAEPTRSATRDPWLDAFRSHGLRATALSVSVEPEKHFLVPELRSRLRDPRFQETRIHEYIVEDVRVQVVLFPNGADADSIVEEGEHREWKPHRARRAYPARRRGRTVLVLESVQRIGMDTRRALSEELLDRILAAFEKAVSGAE